MFEFLVYQPKLNECSESAMRQKLKKPVYCTCKNTKHELSPIVAILIL